MNRKFVAVICGLTLFSGSVLAQESCDAGKLSALVDTYASNPFSARTWRVLNGLGDPMIEPSYSGSDTWENQEKWKSLVAGLLPAGQSAQDVGYECRVGYPLQVLESHVAKLGKESPYVQQWLRVQEQVLKACGNPDAASVAIPEPLAVDASLEEMQAEDRAYQEASVAFYKDKPAAIGKFRAIAATTSPHQAAARYNIANLLANSKDVSAARSEANAILADPALSSVHEITQELLGYIANIEDTPAGWTALIDDSVKAIATATKDIVASENLRHDYGLALNDIDYAGIRGKREDWWLKGTLPADATISKAIFDASRKHPMALWMMAGQSVQEAYDRAPWTLVGDKWQAWTASYLDEALAVRPSGASMPVLAKDVLTSLAAKPDEATRESLWARVGAATAAAQQSCGADAQTAALGPYLEQAVRVSAATGHFDEAYDGLQKMPFKSAFYQSVVRELSEYIVGQGMAEEGRRMRDRLLTPEFFTAVPESMKEQVTNSLAEFLAWVAEDEAHWKSALAMHSDKTANPILNFLSVKMLWTLADDPMFSGNQRALFARVAWTRTYARGETPSDANTAKLYAANPKLKEAANKVAAEFPKLRADRQRLLTILRNPRLGILVNAPDLWAPLEMADDLSDVSSGDRNDRNWWCPLETDRLLAGLRRAFNGNSGVETVDEYSKADLTAVFDQTIRDGLDGKREALLKKHPMIKAVNWKEVTALASMPSAPRLLAQSAIRWGKASKGNDGAPEALALAVRTTRYGCNWHGRHGAYSKPAQQLLLRKFADTSWAKQTPYWFDCQRNEWDKDYSKVAVCDAKIWAKQRLPK